MSFLFFFTVSERERPKIPPTLKRRASSLNVTKKRVVIFYPKSQHYVFQEPRDFQLTIGIIAAHKNWRFLYKPVMDVS